MAAVDHELQSFVREALARGISRAQVEAALRQARWSSEQIANALGGFADIDFPLPVPTPTPYLSAREAFLYLVLFTTLYVSAYDVGSLVFEFIDRAFPDPAARTAAEWSLTRIRWSVSQLIIAFPVFLYVSAVVSRSIARDPVKRTSRVRKWLTYVTLFITAMIIIADLSGLIYQLLGGELTVRFLLKVATVGVIAGVIFGYYLWDLRGEEGEG